MSDNIVNQVVDAAQKDVDLESPALAAASVFLALSGVLFSYISLSYAGFF